MQTIGERLEEARKKKGLSLREAAEAASPRAKVNKDKSELEKQQLAARQTELLAQARRARLSR